MEHETPPRERLLAMDSTELQLRAEIDDLKQQLQKQRSSPTRPMVWSLASITAVLIVAAFLGGYIPRMRRQKALFADAAADAQSIPVANVVTVERSSPRSELVLPGNIQAVTEAPLLARASGYVKHRYVDIGDRVKTGQLLADIEAPELELQTRQAKASLEQARSSLEQATASLQQGKTNEQLAATTAERWKNLAARGVVSKQENDQYQSQREAQRSSVQALTQAVAAARNNVAASEANVARLTEMQSYLKVRAPFSGVITVRNVDVGALISEGTTLLFRVAQTDRLRTYVNVPQSEASEVHVGQVAKLSIADLPRRVFQGAVTRTSNSLDPATRTLLTEVQLANPDGALMPGMYANVDLTTRRQDPPLLIPGDTLVVRADGPQVALVTPDKTVHFQRIQLGRDYGDRLEVLSGLQPGQQIIVNPGDSIREKAKVNPVSLNPPKTPTH